MRLTFDAVRCEGHGKCEGLDPGRFALGDDDELQITRLDVTEGELPLINRVIVSCPRRALGLEA